MGWQSSTIGTLNQNLFVEFRALDTSAEFLIGVRGRLISYSDSLSNNWDSKMEDSNLDNRLSTVSASLQAGLQSGEIADALGVVGSATSGTTSDVANKAKSLASEFKGKTLITKASTTQIWTGSPPHQVDLEVEFKAFSNSYLEVDGAIAALYKMATPKLKDSIVKSAKEALDEYQKSGEATTALKSLLGEIPPDISVSFLGKNYGSVYKIDSISRSSEDKIMIDNTGNNVYQKVSISLSSKQSLNRDDIK